MNIIICSTAFRLFSDSITISSSLNLFVFLGKEFL